MSEAVAERTYWDNERNKGKILHSAIANCWNVLETRDGEGRAMRLDGRM